MILMKYLGVDIDPSKPRASGDDPEHIGNMDYGDK